MYIQKYIVDNLIETLKDNTCVYSLLQSGYYDEKSLKDNTGVQLFTSKFSALCVLKCSCK